MTDEARKTSGAEAQDEASNLPVLAEAAGELPTLAAGLVHEVKNPLAAIHMHLQLLEGYVGEINDDDLRGKINGKVGIIKNEILGLNRTLHNFLSLIRPGVGEKEVSSDLNRLVGEVVDLLEPQALREGIDLQFQPGALESSRTIDASFVKQIVLNLILNSIQAFQASGDPVSEDRAIQVTTGERKTYPYVGIADNGPGIPDDVQARIFDPFFSTKRGKGSGLGLTLVRKMVQEMGGSVELKSAPGEGTRFLVIFGGSAGPGASGGARTGGAKELEASGA
ncbi:MAG: HAMP domain-containing histidine kinase [bacterium]|nr:HAMP domain-containing histidine kinase [bacterium]